MIIELYQRKNYSDDYCQSTKSMILSPSPRVENGEIVKTSEYIEYDYVEYANQFKSSDFALSNLMAIGASDLLVPVTLDVNSNMSIADSFQDFALSFNSPQNV